MALRKRGRKNDGEFPSNPHVVDLAEESEAPRSGPVNVATLRLQLIEKIKALPPGWSNVAARYGVALDPDSVLCAIGKDIATSIRAVTEAAEKNKAAF